MTFKSLKTVKSLIASHKSESDGQSWMEQI